MTRISDELREFADAEVLSAIQISDLKHMAKRIDAEMVELPKDADGVPIHVGDTVWGCISGMQMAVRQLRLTDRWTISTDTGFAPKASAVAHARHDSFERIADELEAWCVGHGMHAETVVEECAEWCGCTPAMMRMVLPALLKDEMRRKKSKKEQEGEGQCNT